MYIISFIDTFNKIKHLSYSDTKELAEKNLEEIVVNYIKKSDGEKNAVISNEDITDKDLSSEAFSDIKIGYIANRENSSIKLYHRDQIIHKGHFYNSLETKTELIGEYSINYLNTYKDNTVSKPTVTKPVQNLKLKNDWDCILKELQKSELFKKNSF